MVRGDVNADVEVLRTDLSHRRLARTGQDPVKGHRTDVQLGHQVRSCLDVEVDGRFEIARIRGVGPTAEGWCQLQFGELHQLPERSADEGCSGSTSHPWLLELANQRVSGNPNYLSSRTEGGCSNATGCHSQAESTVGIEAGASQDTGGHPLEPESSSRVPVRGAHISSTSLATSTSEGPSNASASARTPSSWSRASTRTPWPPHSSA